MHCTIKQQLLQQTMQQSRQMQQVQLHAALVLQQQQQQRLARNGTLGCKCMLERRCMIMPGSLACQQQTLSHAALQAPAG
jgi:hypothetical protein